MLVACHKKHRAKTGASMAPLQKEHGWRMMNAIIQEFKHIFIRKQMEKLK